MCMSQVIVKDTMAIVLSRDYEGGGIGEIAERMVICYP